MLEQSLQDASLSMFQPNLSSGSAAQFSKALNDAHRNLAKGSASGASRPMAFIDFKIPKAKYELLISLPSFREIAAAAVCASRSAE